STNTHPDLHSFPTRRSSDLLADVIMNLLGNSFEGLFLDFHLGAQELLLKLGLHFFAFHEITIVSFSIGEHKRNNKNRYQSQDDRSEEHTFELKSRSVFVCRF